MNITKMLAELKKESAKDNLDHVKFDISIEIDPAIHQKVMHWVNKSDFEVSGLGTVIHDKERNVLRIVDAILLQQENTSTQTELDGEAITKAMFQLKNSPGTLRWWWHSHVNMDVFWSGTDVTAIKTLGGAERDRPAWFCMTVFNKSQKMLSAYVQNQPVRVISADIPTAIAEEIDTDIIAEWDKQYDDNVTNKKYMYVSKGNSGSAFLNKPFWEKEDYTTAVAVSDKEEEEELILLDDLFEAHERGEIDDQEFFAMAAGATQCNLGDEEDILTDEEATQMDIVAMARERQ